MDTRTGTPSGCYMLAESAQAVQGVQAAADPAAGLQPRMVTGVLDQAPEVSVQRIHTTCGRPVVEASLGLADLFDQVQALCHNRDKADR